MYQTEFKSQFKKDLKKLAKQGKNMDLMEQVINTLQQGNPLAAKYRDHLLKGNYKGCRECHIQPDWLLIYRIDGDTLWLIRSGSHSELFS